MDGNMVGLDQRTRSDWLENFDHFRTFCATRAAKQALILQAHARRQIGGGTAVTD
jgi:hypothetical protein